MKTNFEGLTNTIAYVALVVGAIALFFYFITATILDHKRITSPKGHTVEATKN